MARNAPSSQAYPCQALLLPLTKWPVFTGVGQAVIPRRRATFTAGASNRPCCVTAHSALSNDLAILTNEAPNQLCCKASPLVLLICANSLARPSKIHVQVPESEQTLLGPLHAGYYRGCCLAGDDVYEAEMTLTDAIAWAAAHPECFGFTYNKTEKMPEGVMHIWFKSKLQVLYNETWWTYSVGRGMD